LLFCLHVNGSSNVVYISTNGSQHATYTKQGSNFLLREAMKLISEV